MHELAIAEAVIDIAGAHAAGRHVNAVFVKVGHLRQVVPSALEFSFELAAAGTPVEGARLEIEQVPAAGACRACGRESELDGFPLACAACGSLEIELMQGEELSVDSLELDDEMVVSG
jgi:hydrogenase nickel incorporation protein HypA/HybF